MGECGGGVKSGAGVIGLFNFDEEVVDVINVFCDVAFGIGGCMKKVLILMACWIVGPFVYGVFVVAISDAGVCLGNAI